MFAQSATQSGSVTHSGNTCAFRGSTVTGEDEREVRVFIARTQRNGNPRFVYPTVEGPNALARLYDEIGFMDRKVTRNTLRKAFTGKRTTVVLKGTATTPVALSGTPVGSMTVTTALTLTLVGSR